MFHENRASKVSEASWLDVLFLKNSTQELNALRKVAYEELKQWPLATVLSSGALPAGSFRSPLPWGLTNCSVLRRFARTQPFVI